MPPGEWGQVALGLLIPYLLLVHIVNTRGTRILTRIDIDYVYEIANLWVDPASACSRWRWWCWSGGTSPWGCIWLRNREWYRRAMSAVVVVYVMVPLCGLLGFAEVGMTMTRGRRRARRGSSRCGRGACRRTRGGLGARAELKAWVGPAWLGVVAAAVAAAQAELAGAGPAVRRDLPRGLAWRGPAACRSWR